jgi:hypothetical protein
VRGIRNRTFCFDSPICKHCNNTLTQPYDDAWRELLAHVRKYQRKLSVDERIRWATVFPINTQQRLKELQLYFVKQVAGLIADSGMNTPLVEFQRAMQNATTFPHLRIEFFILRGRAQPIIVRTAPFATLNASGDLVRLVYEYILRDFGVRITYAKRAIHLPTGKFAFDPSFGQKWLNCNPALSTTL